MLAKRIVVVFLLRDGRVVKSKRFTDFRDVGDPVSQARIAYANGADEIVFLNTQPRQGVQPLVDVLGKVGEQVFIPVSAGGGIRSLEDVEALRVAGVEKFVIRTATELMPEMRRRYGCQALVQCIDYGRDIPAGPISADAGEVILQNRDRDGMMCGYDVDFLKYELMTDIPVTVLGGCGTFEHMEEAFKAGASACAASSIFCFSDSNPIRAKRWLRNKHVALRSA
jgi:cyclase